MTVSNEDYYFSVYNLTYDSGSHEYSLEVPEFDDVSGNHYDDKDILNFTTYEKDIAGWLNNMPELVDITNSSATIEWEQTTVSANYPPEFPDNTTNYIVYVSNDPYIGFVSVDENDVDITKDNNAFIAVISNLLSGTTYYFRVAPTLGTGREAGFSPMVEVEVPF